MSYTNTWNETTPTSATLANTIAPFFTNNMIAIRERLDDVFGTSALTSIATKDPYAIASIRMTAIADSNVIGGAASWSVRDHTNTYNNLQVMDNGDIIIRSGLIIPLASSIEFRNVANNTTNVLISDDGAVVIGNGLVIAAGGLYIVSGSVNQAEVDAGNSGSAITLDLSLGNNQKLTLTNSCTITLSNPITGGWYQFRIVQGSGGYTVTWPSNFKWSGSFTPVISAAVGAIDIINAYYNGTNFEAILAGFGFTG